MPLWGFYTKDRKVRPITGKVATKVSSARENITRRILLNEKSKKPVFPEWLTYNKLNKLNAMKRVFDGANAQADAISYARRYNGQFYTEVHSDDTWDPIGYERGIRIVNRTGKYLVLLPNTKKNKPSPAELKAHSRLLLDEGYRLLAKHNRTVADNKRLHDIKAELNSIRYLQGKELL